MIEIDIGNTDEKLNVLLENLIITCMHFNDDGDDCYCKRNAYVGKGNVAHCGGDIKHCNEESDGY